MHAWLITVGEPLPTDPDAPRLLRTGIIAELLVRRGHQVTWWSSNFNHTKKIHRTTGFEEHRLGPNFRLLMLPGRAYARNVSVSRILNHRDNAREFEAKSSAMEPPDLILCSYPTIELCVAATRYGRAHGIPVILDIRDLWPDIFLELAPSWARGIARIVLAPMFAASRSACREADALIGITDEFVDWGVSRAGRKASKWDGAYPLAYSENRPDQTAIETAERYWNELGVDGSRPIICFFGTLGRQFDMETVIAAARMLEAKGSSAAFVICGDGESLSRYRQIAQGCRNIVFPGWVDRPKIHALMSMSKAGLAPYFCEDSFTKSIPNKVIEYWSGSLPVLSCLRGVAQQRIEANQCGFHYQEGNPKSLADCVERLLAQPDMVERMAQAAYALYQADFVAENVYGRLINQFEDIARQFKNDVRKIPVSRQLPRSSG